MYRDYKIRQNYGSFYVFYGFSFYFNEIRWLKVGVYLVFVYLMVEFIMDNIM